MASGCCGRPSSRRGRSSSENERLPQNPKISSGVRLIYLGSGRVDFTGKSGSTYVVSEYRRDFTVYPDDVPALLKKRFVIKAP